MAEHSGWTDLQSGQAHQDCSEEVGVMGILRVGQQGKGNARINRTDIHIGLG